MSDLEAAVAPVLCSRCQTPMEPRDGIEEGLALQLTPTERRLFVALRDAPSPLNARQLVSLVWGPEYVATSGSWIATVNISRLKLKLERLQLGWRLVPSGPRHWRTYRVVATTRNQTA